jgi:hypothetical protein
MYLKKTVFWEVAPCRYGATSQKTVFFIVTAVKTSNLTQHVSGLPIPIAFLHKGTVSVIIPNGHVSTKTSNTFLQLLR